MNLARDRIQKQTLIATETAYHIKRLAEQWGISEGEIVDIAMRRFVMNRRKQDAKHR